MAPLNSVQIADLDFIWLYLRDQLEVWQGQFALDQLFWPIFFLLILFLVDSFTKQSWRSPRVVLGVLASIGLYHFNGFVTPALEIAVLAFKEGYEALGIPQVPTAFWSDLPGPLVILIALLSYDFSRYSIHWLLHRKWLWPIHAIHHSDPDVNGLTPFRIHFLEIVAMELTSIVLLTWLGIPAEILGRCAIFLVLLNIYVHVQVDLSHGPFALWLASPRFHRWHHANVKEAQGKNLANVFPFFDRIFGTYYCPGPCTAPMGADGVPENNFPKLLLFPFAEWGKAALRTARPHRCRELLLLLGFGRD
jgi:sterol desaturase/sphingolipid hydroxylase (fatty acid hydroxylase superfamily)